MKHSTRRRLARWTSTLLGLALVATAPALLRAEEGDSADSDAAATVASVLPAEASLAGRFDFERLEKSKYFDSIYDLARERASATEVDTLLDKAGVDIREDLTAIGFATTTTDAEKLKNVEKAVVALRGDFDADELDAAIDEMRDNISEREVPGGRTVRTTEERSTKGDFGIVSEELLVATVGPESYRDQIWSLAAGDGASIQSAIDEGELFEHTRADRSAWMLQRPDGASRAPGGTSLDSAILTVELASGIDIDTVSHATSEDEAAHMKKSIEQLVSNTSEGRGQQMLQALGAQPLVDNLEVRREGSSVIATTSLSETQLDALVERAKQFMAMQAERGQRARGKGQSGGPPGGGTQSLSIPSSDDSSTSGGESSTSEGEQDSQQTGEDGIEADFN